MPKVAGLTADEYIAGIAEYAIAQNWRVESTKNNRLKFLGPNGEGPVYTQLRTHSPRDVDNSLRQLVRAGLPQPDDKNAKAKEAAKEEAEPTGAMLTVVAEQAATDDVIAIGNAFEPATPTPEPEPEQVEADDIDSIFAEYVAVTSKATEKLHTALQAKLATIRRLRTEAAEWEELAQHQVDNTERVTAERDEALRRAEIAEGKLEALRFALAVD